MNIIELDHVLMILGILFGESYAKVCKTIMNTMYKNMCRVLTPIVVFFNPGVNANYLLPYRINFCGKWQT